MLEVHQMPKPQGGNHKAPLLVSQEQKAIINLRGNPQDPTFVQAVQQALGLPLPVAACSSIANAHYRVVWVGPDDWFVIGAGGEQRSLEQRLRTALSGQHFSVTDVSSGYFMVTLAGAQARDVLAQGCPLDLHASVFQPGHSAGTVFFRVGIYLWQRDNAPTFEMLVRRSFIDHFWQLINHCTLDCGWLAKQAA